MGEHVEGHNRNQTALFPDTLEEYVDKDNPVRFIDAFIDSLNMEKQVSNTQYQLMSDGHPITPQTSSNCTSTATSIKSVQAKTRARMPPQP